MLVANVEHRECFIDPEDSTVFESLRHRPGDTSGTGGQIENLFTTFEDEHLRQFLGQIVADA